MSPDVSLASISRKSASVARTAQQRARRAGWNLIASRFQRASQEHRRTQFAALGVPAGRVVFLGDSISEGGLWDEWFPRTPVLNRGIGGETSGQVLRRLDTAVNAPTAVFLLIGTNDLTAGFSPEEITENVRAIVDDIQKRSPDAPVFVQSVMPRTVKYRDDLLALNRSYEAIAAAAPDHVKYVDLWSALTNLEGALRSDFTEDNLHLNGKGYHAWVEVLRPHVDGATVQAPAA
jgi:lysophospholipase L1-like esterase